MSQSEPVVSIVVVSYNTRDLTVACLRSLALETTIPHQVIVVDNASSDGSAAAIASVFPDVTLLAETTNHGFAKANNIGARRATADLLLLLNPDTVVLNGAIDALVQFARDQPSARIWGGRTVFADGSLNPASCWRAMSLWTIICRTTGLDTALHANPILNAEAYGGWARDTERQVDIVSGCFFLIDHSLWRDLEGFDERFVMYGEEADLCLRSRAQGAAPLVTPAAEIIHYGGASEPIRSAKHQRLLRAKISLVQRHLHWTQRTIAVSVLRLWPFSRMVAATTIERLRPGDSNKHRSEEWAAVWSERTEWWDGYPDPEAT